MAYFGAIGIIIATYMIWREYVGFLDKELIFCRSYLGAISDYREKVRCYMQTPRDWARNYSDEYLSECGFLKRLIDGDDFATAYTASSEGSYISDNVDGILASCFARLGEGYLDTELATLEAAIDKLSREETKIRELFFKRRRAAGAVLGAFASGMVILVI